MGLPILCWPPWWNYSFSVDHLDGTFYSQMKSFLELHILSGTAMHAYCIVPSIGHICYLGWTVQLFQLFWNAQCMPTLPVSWLFTEKATSSGLQCISQIATSSRLQDFSRIATSSGLQYISQIATFSGLPYISQIAISSGLLYTSKIATFSGLLYISHTATFSGLVFISQITTSSSGLRLVFMYYTQASCPLCWTTECCLGRTASPFP